MVLGTGRRAQVIAAAATMDKKAKHPTLEDDSKTKVIDLAGVLVSQAEIISSTSVPSMR